MPLLGPNKLKALGHAGGIGFEMVALLLVGLFAGKWLDGQFGTEPTFKLIGLFGGIAAGFYKLLLLTKRPSSVRDEETLDKKVPSGTETTLDTFQKHTFGKGAFGEESVGEPLLEEDPPREQESPTEH